MLGLIQDNRILAKTLLGKGLMQDFGAQSYGTNMADTKLAFALSRNTAGTAGFCDASRLQAIAMLGLRNLAQSVIIYFWNAMLNALARYRSPNTDTKISTQMVAYRHWWRTFKSRTGEWVTKLIKPYLGIQLDV